MLNRIFYTTFISPTCFRVGFTAIRTSCPSTVGNFISRLIDALSSED